MTKPKTLFHILMHIGRRLEHRTNEALSKLSLHHGQGRTLTILMNHGPLTQANLARGMNVRPATVTTMLRPLEVRGLIERFTDPITNRAIVVKLTPQGTELAIKVEQAWTVIEADLISLIPERDREHLFHHLEDLRHSLGGTTPTFNTYQET